VRAIDGITRGVLALRPVLGLGLTIVLVGAAAAQDLVIDGDPVHEVLPPGAIPAIEDPQFAPAAAADTFMAADEMVLGLVIGEDARASSLWHLDSHEIVNDVVGGRAIAAVW